MSNFKIAISAGHGKNTAGKRCMESLDPNQTREWVLNSRIAEKVEKLLGNYTGWDLLRLDDRTGETDVALSTRSKSANAWGAGFYLAIHHNAGVNGGSGGGIVDYVYTKPSDESVAWQKALYEALIEETGLKGNRSNPVAKANFHEVREPDMPAVLLELGFMDSKTDVPIILTEEYADQCARAIVKVIAERGKLVKKGTEAAKTEEPEAPSEPADNRSCGVEVTVLKKGVKGAKVKALQILLIGYGYSCGSSGVDSSFGPATEKALKAYQKANGLEANGQCDVKTLAALLGYT